MTKDKIETILEDGRTVMAQAPVIISASRSTDIPAFYADWFFHRLQIGYSAWTNPFNGLKSYLNYRQSGFIIFLGEGPHPPTALSENLAGKKYWLLRTIHLE